MMDEDFIRDSKVYNNILKHRKTCPHWQNNELCLECFGGGLTFFAEQLLMEYNHR